MPNAILTDRQLSFLALFGGETSLTKKFYLTGGTALAVFYLQHRYSEDLDFFSLKEVDPLELQVFFKKIQKSLGFENLDYQQSYNRNLFFLEFQDETLKTEFTYFPFSQIEPPLKHEEISIDSLLDIATNKLFTIYQRSKARDYIDLFLICREKELTIQELLFKAKAKFDWHIDPLQLGAQFLRAREATDYPRLITHLSPKEWQDFYIREAEKLSESILEKED